MPTRYLKPGVRDSESIDSLSALAETLFYRLLVTVDDFGRYDGRPSMVKAHCFPVKNLTVEVCASLLAELSKAGLVIIYTVDGKPYLQMCKWDNVPRAKESKYPPCDAESVQVHTSACKTYTDAPLTGTGTGTGTETKTKTAEKERSPTGSRLPADWMMTDEMESFCKTERPDLNPREVADRFADYWHGIAGAKGRKVDWMATWRNWVRNEKKPLVGASNQAETAYQRSMRLRMQEAAPESARKDPSKPMENVIDFFAIEVPAKRLEIGK